MSSSDDSNINAIQQKKNTNNPSTSLTTNLQNLITFSTGAVKTVCSMGVHFALGGVVLYGCKVAQSNVLATDTTVYPYTELPYNTIPTATNIFTTFSSPAQSMKLTIPFHKSTESGDIDNSNFIILNALRENKYSCDTGTSGMFFTSIIDGLFGFNYAFLKYCLFVLNYLPEIVILLFGPIILFILTIFLLILSNIYIIYLWISNLSWFFYERPGQQSATDATPEAFLASENSFTNTNLASNTDNHLSHHTGVHPKPDTSHVNAKSASHAASSHHASHHASHHKGGDNSKTNASICGPKVWTPSPLHLLLLTTYIAFLKAIIFLIVMIIFIFIPLIPLVACLITIWSVFGTLFGYTGSLNGNQIGYLGIIRDTFKYHKVAFMVVISLLLVLSAFSILGVGEGIFLLITLILITYGVIKISVFKSIHEDGLSPFTGYEFSKVVQSIQGGGGRGSKVSQLKNVANNNLTSFFLSNKAVTKKLVKDLQSAGRIINQCK